MIPPGIGATTYTLHPGDVAIGLRGDRMETLLGSCISIILSDSQRTIAAMCHIVHAAPPLKSASGIQFTAHAEPALRAMFTRLLERGVSPRLCDAYLYGGGNMFPHIAREAHIGQTNSNWARDRLSELGMRIVACDVGGTVYRRVRWTVGPDEPSIEAVPV